MVKEDGYSIDLEDRWRKMSLINVDHEKIGGRFYVADIRTTFA